MGHPGQGIMIGQGYGCKSYGCRLCYEHLRAQVTIGCIRMGVEIGTYLQGLIFHMGTVVSRT
jgi:hypothetical protein